MRACTRICAPYLVDEGNPAGSLPLSYSSPRPCPRLSSIHRRLWAAAAADSGADPGVCRSPVGDRIIPSDLLVEWISCICTLAQHRRSYTSSRDSPSLTTGKLFLTKFPLLWADPHVWWSSPTSLHVPQGCDTTGFYAYYGHWKKESFTQINLGVTS